MSTSSANVTRILGVIGPNEGPTLICVAGLHGNEPAGVRALQRMFSDGSLSDVVLRGRIAAFAGNLPALAEGRRYIDEDLNRIWRKDRLQPLREGRAPTTVEEAEMLELDRDLQRALADCPSRPYLLDLHTTSGPGPAFVVLDDRLDNRAFALELPSPIVLGLEEEVEGTLSHYLGRHGSTAIGFESGQHTEEDAIDRAEAAIWVTMEAAGVVGRGLQRVRLARERLAAEAEQLPRVVEVRYRHALGPADAFQMSPGFVSFGGVEEGQLIAHNNGSSIEAPSDGRILMPLYQSQGDDGFFIVSPVDPNWLTVSSVLRRLRLDRVAHWLPGVSRDGDDPLRVHVDRRLARWGALELFHLLGYRRKGVADRHVTMIRRAS